MNYNFKKQKASGPKRQQSTIPSVDISNNITTKKRIIGTKFSELSILNEESELSKTPEFFNKIDYLKNVAIQKRNDIQNIFSYLNNDNIYVNTPLADYINDFLIDVKNKRYSTNDYTTWIGGSRSWYENIKNYISFNDLTLSEKVAIKPGNFDVFYLTNNTTDAKNIANILCMNSQNLIERLNLICKLVKKDNYYQVEVDIDKENKENILKTSRTSRRIIDKNKFPLFTLESRAIDNNCIPYDMEKGESFPGYGSLIYLNIDKDTRILVCYLEVFCFINKNNNIINMFNKNYLMNVNNYNYLNEYGLLLFNQLIMKKRYDKGYDIDNDRLNILWKLLELRYPNDIKSNKIYALINCASTYKELWKHSYWNIKNDDTDNDFILFNKTFLNSLYISALKNASYLKINDFCDYFEEKLIETWRSPINSCIRYIKDVINNKYNGNAFITIVGGDAMRRYGIGDITKDIDAKIFYHREKDYANIKDDIIKILSSFTCEFILNKKKIFNNYNQFSNNDLIINNNNMIKIKLPDELINNTDINIKYINDDDNNLQFRLRYIRKNEILPVDLFSIDYRANIFVNTTYKYINNGEDINGALKFDNNYDIPILDVVLQKENLKDFNKIKEMMGDNINLDVPYASDTYLYYDVKKIYSNEDSTKLRIYANKTNKDKTRYYSFKNKIFNNIVNNLNEYDIELYTNVLNNLADVNKEGIITYSKQYYKYFKLNEKYRGYDYVKYSLPYNLDMIDKKIQYINDTKKYEPLIVNLSSLINNNKV